MSNCKLTCRDINVLKFLWRWKISSTAIIQLMLFPQSKPRSTYNKLNRLRKAGFLNLYFLLGGELKLWGINKKAFKEIEIELPVVESKFLRSESPYHDFQTHLVHLGLFKTLSNHNLTIHTEQELRSLNKEELNPLIRSMAHRPDGYLVFNKENVVSIEIELSKKSDVQYQEIGTEYGSNESIKSVIWFVKSLSLARLAHTDLKRGGFVGEFKHSFVFLQDFLEKSFESIIFGGKFKGKSLKTLIESVGGKVPVNCDNNFTRTLQVGNSISCWKN